MGNKTSKRVFLNGINECTLESVKMSQSRTGRYYIEVQFSRKAEVVFGTRETFANLVDYLFFPDPKLGLICNCFGHELKPIPDAYPIVSYLMAVSKRLSSFIGKEIKVAVKNYTDVVKDNYGVVMQAFYLNNSMMDKHTTRTEVLGYYPIQMEVEVDWKMWL